MSKLWSAYIKSLKTAKYTPSAVQKGAHVVEKKATVLSLQQASNAISSAWKSIFGEDPDPRAAAILTAQWAMETGHGKSMFNYNFGGIKGAGPSGLTVACRTAEGHGESKEYIVDYFRAYGSAEEGAVDYVNLLNKRYSDAIAEARKGNAEGFVHKLKSHGYFTGSESEYTSAVKSISNQISKGSTSTSTPVSESTSTPTRTAPSAQQANKPKGYLDKAREYLSGLFGGDKTKSDSSKQTAQATPAAPGASSSSILDTILHQIFANEKQNLNLYKKLLPQNNILIKISSKNYDDSFEFANLLCSVLDEELLSESNIHSDNSYIEVYCSIPGPQKECVNLIKELTYCLKSSFKQATNKIGSIDIDTDFILNKTPSYKETNFKQAEFQHRKFLLKFV